MTLHNPARRPWGTARGARTISRSAWAVVVIAAMLTAVWWVKMLDGDQSMLTPAIVVFNVSIFAALGALGIDLGTAQRRGEEESAALPRLPGSWVAGAGIGAMATNAFVPGRDMTVLLWGLLMFAAGALAFFSPVLLERYRAARTRSYSRTRATGTRTQATVTEVRVFYREHFAHQRVTMTFTDQDGGQRWFTKTAAAGTRPLVVGRKLPLHYDAARPQHKRTLVVDWPTY